MCGIVGYSGSIAAQNLLIEGLEKLEYRGYDSAGLAVLNGKIQIHKSVGNIASLRQSINSNALNGNCGIAHTRWATHGEPNEVNAHPHLSNSGMFALVHNGIIENYEALKIQLKEKGFVFHSDTDSEVLLNLIESKYVETQNVQQAIKLSCAELEGSYAFALINNLDPGKVYAIRSKSPLVIGQNEQGTYLASDLAAIATLTNKVIYPDDHHLILLDENNVSICDLEGNNITPERVSHNRSSWNLEKNGYDHYMLKEIIEQPTTLRDSFIEDLHPSVDGPLAHLAETLINANRIIVSACGTSWHAGLVGEYFIERIARIPVEVEYASEFRYRNPVIRKGDVVISVSQSGETADTLAANSMAAASGATTIAICNVPHSTITRETDAQLFLNAGTEVGVASTKAYTSQISIFFQLAIFLANLKGEKTYDTSALVDALHALPVTINNLGSQLDEQITSIVSKYAYVNNFLYLGRGVNFPSALEGALKLKEISYIHAEGYPGAEMKHGPIALIDWNFPTIAIATDQENYSKMISNIKEIQARKGKIIAIVNEGDTEIKAIADHCIEIPKTIDLLSPITSAIPLQLFSYHMALARGCNVDQPRNLAKSVTVE
ncbi:glutamine--fructose-6-phosphate transaminase (isomerizing) [Puteibacter caeruleilacunae]|nr:glutamine--fructose-6-phosphate transaminase (isomerizing) [Puteibacter caeruleilacunae]